MTHVEVVRRFDSPPARVWEVYTDHARMSEWSGLAGARLVREGSPQRNGSGAIRGFAAGAREEILDFEPPRRMTYRVIAGPLPLKDHLGEAVLEPDGSGTRLTWRCRFRPSVPGTGWLLRRVITRVFARALEGLAARV